MSTDVNVSRAINGNSSSSAVTVGSNPLLVPGRIVLDRRVSGILAHRDSSRDIDVSCGVNSNGITLPFITRATVAGHPFFLPRLTVFYRSAVGAAVCVAKSGHIHIARPVNSNGFSLVDTVSRSVIASDPCFMYQRRGWATGWGRRCRSCSSRRRRRILAAISAACVRKAADVVDPAPDNHFAASPHCFVFVSGRWGVDGASSHPAVGAWVVSRTRINVVEPVIAAPHYHFAATPH